MTGILCCLFLYYLLFFIYEMFHVIALLLGNSFLLDNQNLLFSLSILEKTKNARFLGQIMMFICFFITIPIDVLRFCFAYILGIFFMFMVYLLNKNISFKIVSNFIKLKKVDDIIIDQKNKSLESDK